jgi:hypothetical protein
VVDHKELGIRFEQVGYCMLDDWTVHGFAIKECIVFLSTHGFRACCVEEQQRSRWPFVFRRAGDINNSSHIDYRRASSQPLRECECKLLYRYYYYRQISCSAKAKCNETLARIGRDLFELWLERPFVESLR